MRSRETGRGLWVISRKASMRGDGGYKRIFYFFLERMKTRWECALVTYLKIAVGMIGISLRLPALLVATSSSLHHLHRFIDLSWYFIECLYRGGMNGIGSEMENCPWGQQPVTPVARRTGKQKCNLWWGRNPLRFNYELIDWFIDKS